MDRNDLIDRIADLYQIGSEARKFDSVVFANVETTYRHSRCLFEVEKLIFGEDMEGKPSWGANPEEYAKQFKEALSIKRKEGKK